MERDDRSEHAIENAVRIGADWTSVTETATKNRGAWTLRNPAVDGAIVGFRRPGQAAPILVVASLEFADEDIDEIEGGNS